MKMKLTIIILAFLTALIWLGLGYIRGAFNFVDPTQRKYTVEKRLEMYESRVRKRLVKDFEKAGMNYPPAFMTLIAFKNTNILEVYAQKSKKERAVYIKSYRICAASGKYGPKLREGDLQVPEGVYSISYLNPNSRFHLSLGLNYPNNFDRTMAAGDGRKKLGSAIMIHGNCVSIGCLAMGDKPAEDLFITTALIGRKNVKVIISPVDFRKYKGKNLPTNPPWIKDLYNEIRRELENYKRQ